MLFWDWRPILRQMQITNVLLAARKEIREKNIEDSQTFAGYFARRARKQGVGEAHDRRETVVSPRSRRRTR